jgi:hypothetical protein
MTKSDNAEGAMNPVQPITSAARREKREDLKREHGELTRKLEDALREDPLGTTPAVTQLEAECDRVWRSVDRLADSIAVAEQDEAQAARQRREDAIEQLKTILTAIEAERDARAVELHATSRPSIAAIERVVTLAREVYVLRQDLCQVTGDLHFHGSWSIRTLLGPLVNQSPTLNRSPFERKQPILRPWQRLLDVARGEPDQRGGA